MGPTIGERIAQTTVRLTGMPRSPCFVGRLGAQKEEKSPPDVIPVSQAPACGHSDRDRQTNVRNTRGTPPGRRAFIHGLLASVTIEADNGNSLGAFGGGHRCTWQDAVTCGGEIDCGSGAACACLIGHRHCGYSTQRLCQITSGRSGHGLFRAHALFSFDEPESYTT